MDHISIPADFATIAIRLAAATLLGAAAGLNREMLHKPAGLRTHALVALGTALAALVGLELTALGPGGDLASASRVIQGLLAGVGFIGGGVILHRDDEKGAHGLTTAASIWIVATVGIATGVGMWRSASLALGLTLAVLVLGKALDRRIDRRVHFRSDDAKRPDAGGSGAGRGQNR